MTDSNIPLRETIASRLDGVEYREFPSDVVASAKAGRVVIISGQSDDIIAIDGAISDEVYSDFRISRTKILPGFTSVLEDATELASRHGDDDPRAMKVVQEWFREHARSVVVKGALTREGWQFSTEAPHSTFRVMEDGEQLFEGLVIALDELPGGTSESEGVV